MTLFDTHAHLNDARFADDREEVLRRALAAGVARVVEVADSPTDWDAAVALSRARPAQVRCSLGLHPLRAAGFDGSVPAALARRCAVPEVVAVGELGLDFSRQEPDRGLQLEVFLKLLDAAAPLGLPLVIHCRAAYAELLRILAGWKPPGPGRFKGVLHCFSAGKDEAQEAVRLGFALGVDGPITYPKNAALREAALSAGLDNVVLETDSPYLPPQSSRGRRNEPALLPEIAQALASVFGLAAEALAAAATANAEALFSRMRPPGGRGAAAAAILAAVLASALPPVPALGQGGPARDPAGSAASSGEYELAAEPLKGLAGLPFDRFIGVHRLTKKGPPRLLFSAPDGVFVVDPASGKPSPVPLESPGFSFSRVLDADGDGRPEFAFSRRDGTRLRAVLADASGRSVASFETYGSHDSGMDLRWVGTLKPGGRRVALAAVSSGYSRQPRGVWAFDFETGAELWRLQTGPSVTDVEAADLDGDGAKEIAVGSYAPGNGASAPDGSDDMHSYVWLLGPDGGTRWRKEFGAHFTGVSLRCRDLGGDGKARIVAFTSAAHHFREDEGRVVVLDAKGGEHASYDNRASITSLEFLPKGRRLTVVAGDRVGKAVRIHFDGTPDAVRQLVRSSYPSAYVHIKAVADLGGPGRRLVVASSHEEDPRVTNPRTDSGPANVILRRDMTIWLLDEDLNPVHAQLLAPEPRDGYRLEATPPGFASGGAPGVLFIKGDSAEFYRIRRRRKR